MVALGPQLFRFMVPFYYLYGSISLMTLWAIFHPRETISHVTRTAGNISAVTCLTLLQRAWLQVFANNVINHQFRRPAKAIYNIAQRRHRLQHVYVSRVFNTGGCQLTVKRVWMWRRWQPSSSAEVARLATITTPDCNSRQGNIRRPSPGHTGPIRRPAWADHRPPASLPDLDP